MVIRNNISESLRLRRRRQILFRWGIVVFLLLIIGGNFCYLSWLDIFQIKSIEILGESSIAKEELVNSIEKNINGGYWGIISKSNYFFVPKSYIKINLLDDYIKLKDIQIAFPNRNKMIVQIEERKPEAIWCDSVNSLCYFVDKGGVLYAEAPETDGVTLLKLFGKINVEENLIGTSFTSFEQLKFFSDGLEKLNFSPVLIEFADGYYLLKLKEGGKIYFDLNQTIEKTLNDVSSMVKNGVIKVDAEFLSKINHLDLRYGNKVHFDFRP